MNNYVKATAYADAKPVNHFKIKLRVFRQEFLINSSAENNLKPAN